MTVGGLCPQIIHRPPARGGRRNAVQAASVASLATMGLELSARELKDETPEDALIREEGHGHELEDRPQASQSASASASRPRSLAVTVFVCLVFTAVGPTLILTNKYLMSRCKFPYPILLTCSGQISSSIISFFLVRVLRVVPHTPMSWPVYLRSVSVVGLMACLAMASGNSTYLYLTVSFIEILKGFTPVVTIMVQAVFGQAFPRPIAGLAVLMISLGTAISSYGEMELNLVGVSLMLASVYCEAMRLMLTQRLLQAAPSPNPRGLSCGPRGLSCLTQRPVPAGHAHARARHAVLPLPRHAAVAAAARLHLRPAQVSQLVSQ